MKLLAYVLRSYRLTMLLSGVLSIAIAATTVDRSAADEAPKGTASDSTIAQGELSLVETADKLAIQHSGKLVLEYNKTPPPLPAEIDPVYRRDAFLHPVHSPSGKTVTASYPVDHAHQDGIFSAWVKTTYDGQAVDFWNIAGGTGRVVHQRVAKTFADNGGVGFEVDLIHRATLSQDIDVLRETWRVTARPTAAGYYCFDIETTQRALTDKPLIVEEYHYGGMAVRGPVSWIVEPSRENARSGEASGPPVDKHEASRMLNSLGSDRIRGNHEHVQWVALTGTVNGEPATLAVLSHRDNFRAPQAARLHPTKPYFVYSPCVDGQFTIDREHPLHGQYRFLVTDQVPNPAWLDAQWQAWCK